MLLREKNPSARLHGIENLPDLLLYRLDFNSFFAEPIPDTRELLHFAVGVLVDCFQALLKLFYELLLGWVKLKFSHERVGPLPFTAFRVALAENIKFMPTAVEEVPIQSWEHCVHDALVLIPQLTLPLSAASANPILESVEQ